MNWDIQSGGHDLFCLNTLIIAQLLWQSQGKQWAMAIVRSTPGNIEVRMLSLEQIQLTLTSLSRICTDYKHWLNHLWGLDMPCTKSEGIDFYDNHQIPFLSFQIKNVINMNIAIAHHNFRILNYTWYSYFHCQVAWLFDIHNTLGFHFISSLDGSQPSCVLCC